MTTALDIITRAMQQAGILFKKETPDADEASDALIMLNSMLASYSNDSMLITARVRETFPLLSQISYTIGPGGDFNTVRPTYIVELHVQQDTLTFPLGFITDESYERIAIKNIQGIPKFFNYSNGFELGRLYFYPYPDSSFTLHITSEKPLIQFPLLTTDVDLPPGWEDLLVYNLGARLCPSYGQPITPELKFYADESLRSIRYSIIKSRTLDAYPQALTKPNIYTGWNI